MLVVSNIISLTDFLLTLIMVPKDMIISKITVNEILKMMLDKVTDGKVVNESILVM